MSVQRISSFKSFTEVKNQQASIKMHEENKTKREQLLAKIGQTLEEEGVTSFDELDEEKRTALVAKIFNEDRAEDIEADKVKMGEPKKHEDEEGKKVQSTNESLVTEATRSQIGKIDKAGKITSVYVHWDGNPNTRIPLLKHYKDSKTLNKLLDLGKYGISSLEKQIGDKPQDFDKPDRGITTFYGRDRDEKDRDMTMKSDVKSISKYLKDAGNESNSEYVYLFDERDGKWYMADVYDDKELKPVKESVEVNEDIDIHDKTADLMNKLQVQIGNLLHATKGNKEWTKELEAIKSAFEKLEDRISIANKKLGMIPESVEINEGFEVHYSDGVRAMKKFGMQSQAMAFAKDLIKNKKGLQFVDVFNAGSNFHSTADTNAIVAFWGDGSYTDNVSKKDPKLAAKKIDESVEVFEGMFGSKDFDKTLVTYAIDKKADEIYIVSVDKVIHSSFPDVSKLEDKRFRMMFGVMLEENWLKQYDKLPKVGDILPAPKKDKAFESVEVTESSLRNSNEKPAELTKDETMAIAQKFADAISKVEGKKVTVNKRTLEEDSFDLDIDGEEFDGGSYMIFRNGNVRNAALPKNPIYGKTTDSVATIIKNLKSIKESVDETVESIDEARSINKIQNEWTKVTADMKSTVDSWKKAEGDAKASLLAKLKELTAKKNSLESELNDAISDKDKDLELVVSEAKNNEGNAFVYAAAKAKKEGKTEFEFNGETHKVEIEDTNLKEEVAVAVEINEEDITSDEQFKEYAFKVLKQAFEADFDEAKAQEVVDGILKVAGSNYGEAVGMLTSSLG